MKKIVKRIFILIFLISSTLWAQSAFDYGLKVGITSSSIRVTDKNDDHITDLNEYFGGNSSNPFIGLFLNYGVNKNLFLEAELSYIPKGSRKTSIVTHSYKDYGSEKFSSTSGMDLRYLELGFNVKPTILLSNTPTYLIIGASVNYKLDAINITQYKMKEFTFSYKLGVGYKINDVLSIPFSIEVKYIGDFSSFYSIEDYNARNSVVLFGLGFYL